MRVRTNLNNWLVKSAFLLGFVLSSLGYAADSNLVGYWKFDGNTLDASSYMRHATLRGNPQFVAGYYGSALELGENDWVNIDGYKGITGTDAFSITAWIKTSSDGEIIGWGQEGNGTRMEFRVDSNRLRSETGSGGYNVQGETNVTDGQWHHVAVTVKDNVTFSYPDVIIYLDGEDDTRPKGSRLAFSIGAAFDVKMGIRFNQRGRKFLGLIDDVRIYDKALTQDEVEQILHLNNTPPDVDAGYYHSVVWRGEPVTVQLDATVYDDDPCGYGILNLQWSKVSGPDSVEFLPGDDIEDPCALFSAPGAYALLLQAWDEVPKEGNNIAIIFVKEPLPDDIAADLAAWERIKDLEIPGIDVDQRFKITDDIRFVSPTGDDSNSGTIDSPWKTLSKAASSMMTDRVIYLRAGTYYGPVTITVKGVSGQPAALRGYPGEHVIVQYPQSFIDENQTIDHYVPLIQIKAHYVEVSNLHLIGAGDLLPQHHFSENGIWLREDVGGRILYNEIENVGHCGVKGGYNALIEGNYIHGLGHGSVDHSIYCPNDDTIIRKNLIINSTGFGVHAYKSPARLEITHNILIGHHQYGIVLAGPDCRVLHNLFYHNNRGGIFLFRRHCLDNVVKNNIFDEPVRAFDHDSRGREDQSEHPQNNLMDYNCLVPITPRGRPSPYDTYGVNNFTADPRWVNPDQLDFRLTRTSPCIGAGQDEGYGSNCGPFNAPAPLSRSAEDFETGDFSRLPWEHSGNENWTVTLRQKHTGAYSAKAGAIEDDGNTTLKVTLDCIDGDVTFYCKVSSESGSDCLKFHIDGVKQGEWSGEQDWAEVSFPVTAGTRTFEWTYLKDGSESNGDDTAWIDDIAFPI